MQDCEVLCVAHRGRPVRLGGDAWAATSTYGRRPSLSIAAPAIDFSPGLDKDRYVLALLAATS
ncbi:hypothetical protein E2562_000894 [Oryza meyeriana var. granulata]|uniref:Uncharacterized protein n=1 Tax=Oryza meyeriana var. granulata TaxID=110450 RepID=A0A6G1CYA3_9ORYZ|nr:hypothetical protein E2562_000894 [Oryza meyeriana var. granulata]